LDDLHPEEVRALGYELRALIPRNWGYTSDMSAVREDVIRAIHRHIKAGVFSLLTKSRWRSPVTSQIVLRRDDQDDHPTYRIGFSWKGTESDAILGGIMDLLVEVGDKLRACPRCHEPFVKNRRQAYCSVACSQKTRDRRKQERGES